MIKIAAASGLAAAEAALEHLNIKYRKLDFGNGSLLLCTLPNSLTFDLFVGDDPTIKLWSFIGTAPADKAGVRWEYKEPDQLYPVIGMEVTDEGDLNFYAIQTLAPNGKQSVRRVCKLVKGYSKIITNVKFQHTPL